MNVSSRRKTIMQHSESLLTEILLLLQNLNSNVHQFEGKLTEIKRDFEGYKTHIDGIIAKAFPDGLVETHHEHHGKISRGSWVKRLIKRIDRSIT
jgi:hypothetical protein